MGGAADIELVRVCRRVITWDDRSFEAIEDNLAHELVLLTRARQGQARLHIWESPIHAVVLGYGRSQEADVYGAACAAAQVPVVRRRSGGGTVLLGPGCLCYSLALPLTHTPELQDITATNRWVLDRVASTLRAAEGLDVTVSGISDLTLGEYKIGGSAQRRTREAILWHGTVLYAFDLAKIAEFLREPDRQPDYRQARRHRDFVKNLALSRTRLVALLTQAFDAQRELGES